jgi:hypothetical protein
VVGKEVGAAAAAAVVFKPTSDFARIRPAAMQASPRALTAHLAVARGAIEQAPKQEILASNIRTGAK